MGEFKYDLAVAYRVYPKPSRTAPPVFGNDKFKLVEVCFKSFKASVAEVRAKIWILVDSCPPEYEAMFREVWGPADLTFVRYQGISAPTALKEQIRILTEQTDAEIIYCAEDDYCYLPGQFKTAVDFLKQNPDADFVSPYDHPDIHNTELHAGPKPTKSSGGKVWTSCGSTTHTFLTRRSTLLECQSVFQVTQWWDPFRLLNGIMPDLSHWLALTKRRVFDLGSLLQWCRTHRYWALSILIAWNYHWKQILFGRRRTLWVPQPSLATHLSEGYAAPGIDWAAEFRRYLAGSAAAPGAAPRPAQAAECLTA
jgi:hypothetical protein